MFTGPSGRRQEGSPRPGLAFVALRCPLLGRAGSVSGGLESRPGGRPGCRRARRASPSGGARSLAGRRRGRRGRPPLVPGLQEGWLDAGRAVFLEASGTVRVWTPLTRRWHVFLVLFSLFFFFVGELLQVVFGADLSERLVMCSVREVSGLGGGQRAAVARSPAEGGRGSQSDGDLGWGDHWGRWFLCQEPRFCPAWWPRAGMGPGCWWEWTVGWPSYRPEWLTSRKRVLRGGGPVGQCLAAVHGRGP